jgi:hypothetical protein
LGNGATVGAAFTNSTALGFGAAANNTNQMMFGTASTSYQAPGITSAQSLSRQSGPLQLTTTDAAGHLASDGGAVFRAIARAQAGIAIALAVEAPSLTESERFGVRVGWGNFEGDANAFGLSAMGVLCRGCFSQGDRIALDGSIGIGSSDFMSYGDDNVVASRLGVQWTWR